MARIGVAVACVAAALVAVAPANALQTTTFGSRPVLKVSCYSKNTGIIRYVTSSSKCRTRTEGKISYFKDAPVYTCYVPRPVGVHVARVPREDRRGLMRRVGSASACHGYELTLPRIGPRSFCVDEPGHQLRNLAGGYPCHKRGEKKVILPGTGPKKSGGGGNGNPGGQPNPGGPVEGQSTPVVNNDSATTDENTAITIDVLANDTDSNPAQLHIDSVNTAGTKGQVTVDANTKLLSYNPNGQFRSLKVGETATDTFTYVARHGSNISSSATVTVTITGVNEAPVAVADSAVTDKLTAATITVLGNDTDGDNDPLTVSSIDTTGTQGLVTISPDHKSVTYDPNGKFPGLTPGQTATDTFKYTANDGHVDSAPATVTITITGVNVPPVLSGIEVGAIAYPTAGGPTQLTNTLAVADSDGTTLVGATVKITTGYAMGLDKLVLPTPAPGGITGTFDALSGTLTLAGATTIANYEAALRTVTYEDSAPTPTGSRVVSFQVDDGGINHNLSNTVTRSITVTHVNHAPDAAHDDAGAVGEDGPAVDIDVLANDTDPDLDALHIASIDTATDATKGSVSIVAGKAHYDPNGQFEALAQGVTATDTFRYTPADTSNVNAPAAGKVVVTVTGANDPPTLAGIEPTTLSAPSGASTQVTNTLLVDDADTGAQITAAKIQITSGLTAGDTLTLPAGGPVAISAAAFDSSTGTLTLSGTDTLAHYQQALRSITYDASGAAASPPTRVVTFSITDDHSAISNLQSRAISINHVNHAPIAVDDGAAQGAVVGEDGGPVAIDVVANDADPDLDTPLVVDPASIDTATDSTKGLVGPVDINGKIPYDPNGQFESLPEGVDGTDAFRYKVADPSNANSVIAGKVVVTVTCVDDPPVAVNDSATVLEDAARTRSTCWPTTPMSTAARSRSRR